MVAHEGGDPKGGYPARIPCARCRRTPSSRQAVLADQHAFPTGLPRVQGGREGADAFTGRLHTGPSYSSARVYTVSVSAHVPVAGSESDRSDGHTTIQPCQSFQSWRVPNFGNSRSELGGRVTVPDWPDFASG